MGSAVKAGLQIIASICLVTGMTVSAQITQIGTSLNISSPITVPLMAGRNMPSPVVDSGFHALSFLVGKLLHPKSGQSETSSIDTIHL